MAIRREATSDETDFTDITFTLPDDGRGGVVSVVGSFNDWTPGRDPLEATGDGDRAVTITVPASADVHFRYLGSDGEWFDDADADMITADGGVIRGGAGDDPAGKHVSAHHTVAEAAAMGPLPGSTVEDDATGAPAP